jgi:2',3'-cyclic-nucleotide 2'-phosphodiesterase (5'-nucleotidase family)
MATPIFALMAVLKKWVTCGKLKKSTDICASKVYHVYRIQQLAFYLVAAAGLAACNRPMLPQEVAYSGYTISATHRADSALGMLLQPYRDSVERSMGVVVGQAIATLEKARPSSSLGNFMADAVLHMAAKRFDRTVHFSLLNYGGIRLTQLPQGPVTRGKIFELMPFDNLIVLQELSGAQVQELLDFIAAQGGWPVAGVSFTIRNKKATDIIIAGKPFNLQQTYTIANSDYVANGGDGAAFMRSIPQATNGYLVRDALFDYVSFLQSQNMLIVANNEMRINHVQ